MSQSAAIEKHVKPAFVRRRSNRRREIIDAAIDQFSARGYDGATLKGIAEAIDLTHAALYYYYKSKDVLLFEAVSLILNELLDTLKGCGGAPRAQLKSMMVAQLTYQFEYHRAMPLIDSVLFGAHSRRGVLKDDQSRHLRQCQKDMIGLYHSAVEAGIKSGEFTCKDVRTTVFSIIGILSHAPYWASPVNDEEMDAFVEKQTDICFRLL